MNGYYTLDQMIEMVDELVEAGWKFKAHSYEPTTGWWVLPDSDDPVKAMRRGDPKQFYQGAVTTLELYV